MGIAGLWSSWRNPAGDVTFSYTMQTIKADQHPFMRQFHKPDDEKRSVVILHEQDYDAGFNHQPRIAGHFCVPIRSFSRVMTSIGSITPAGFLC